MMNKSIIKAASISFALSVTISVNAQDLRSITMQDIRGASGEIVTATHGMKMHAPDYDRIGEALWEVIYDYRVQTTMESKDPVGIASSNGGERITVRANDSGETPSNQDHTVCDTYTTLLQVGAGQSRFLDYLAFRVDSLSFVPSVPEDVLLRARKEMDRSAFYFEPVVFQNWPEGSLTVDDILVPGTFSYTETMALKWIVGEGQKEVCGYICQEARTSYGGRDWIVWFAPTIPTTAGPWKLCGLPGLIMEAQDVDGIHHFTAIGMRQAGGVGIVRLQDSGREKTKRDLFIKRKNASGGNSFDNVPPESITSIDVIKNDSGGVIKINGRMPIRMNGHAWVPLELR